MKWMACALLLTTGALPARDDLVFRSGAERVHLLELFTSEGCSSCPPAEESFARLVAREKLWTRVVPLAWHVDYWDYLGWPDRFASAAHSQRERAYASAWHSTTVYTPCFVLDGNEWKGDRKAAASGENSGVLQAALAGGELQITFSPAQQPQKPREAWVALLSGEETSQVTAGENAGRKLTHLLVVKSSRHLPMTQEGRNWRATIDLQPTPGAKALAVWIARDGLEPEQATGGWLGKADLGQP